MLRAVGLAPGRAIRHGAVGGLVGAGCAIALAACGDGSHVTKAAAINAALRRLDSQVEQLRRQAARESAGLGLGTIGLVGRPPDGISIAEWRAAIAKDPVLQSVRTGASETNARQVHEAEALERRRKRTKE